MGSMEVIEKLLTYDIYIASQSIMKHNILVILIIIAKWRVECLMSIATPRLYSYINLPKDSITPFTRR